MESERDVILAHPTEPQWPPIIIATTAIEEIFEGISTTTTTTTTTTTISSFEDNPTTADDGNTEQATINHTHSTTRTTYTTHHSNPTDTDVLPTPHTSSNLTSSDHDTYPNEAQTGGGSRSSGGLSTGTKIAIAVPVAVVGAAILAIILFFLIRRRRRRRIPSNPETIGSSPLPPQIDMSQFTNTRNLPETEFLVTTPQGIPTVPAPIPRRPVPQRSEDETRPLGPGAGVGAGAGVVDRDAALEWRTSEERRPRSPFDHPLDDVDAMSDVSGISERHGGVAGPHSRGIEDDLSSVSSFEDDDRPPGLRSGNL